MSKNFPAKELLRWFDLNARPLPWRQKNPDPYQVWISEIMSQQSTMPTVVSYFQKWMKIFPNFEKFSNATEEEICQLWAGLGYYSRARNIFKTKELLCSFIKTNGNWPKTQMEWLSLPGIGPYTSAAITSVVFGEAVLALDGNVMRVLSRFWGVPDPLNKPSDKKCLEEGLESLAKTVNKGLHGPLTQSLMELGALVCRPGPKALCHLCPLKKHCWAFNKSQVETTPKSKIRKKSLNIRVLGLIYHQPKAQEKILLRQIPTGKRLAGQWEVPQWHLSEEEFMLWDFPLRSRFEIQGPIKHAITHHMYKAYRVSAGAWKGKLPPGHCFVDLSLEHPKMLVTTMTKKIIKGD